MAVKRRFPAHRSSSKFQHSSSSATLRFSTQSRTNTQRGTSYFPIPVPIPSSFPLGVSPCPEQIGLPLPSLPIGHIDASLEQDLSSRRCRNAIHRIPLDPRGAVKQRPYPPRQSSGTLPRTAEPVIPIQSIANGRARPFGLRDPTTRRESCPSSDRPDCDSRAGTTEARGNGHRRVLGRAPLPHQTRGDWELVDGIL